MAVAAEKPWSLLGGGDPGAAPYTGHLSAPLPTQPVHKSSCDTVHSWRGMGGRQFGRRTTTSPAISAKRVKRWFCLSATKTRRARGVSAASGTSATTRCFTLLKTPLNCRTDAGRLALAGDSAGGNMAAASAPTARDRKGPPILLQVLIDPAPDLTGHGRTQTAGRCLG